MPENICEACDLLNAIQVTERRQKPLLTALSTIVAEDLNAITFAGMVNRIREKHPRVTTAFAGLWLALGKAVGKANGYMRYPQLIEKTRDFFDRALFLRLSEEDTDDEAFELSKWLEPYSDCVRLVVDMRRLNTALTEKKDWALVLRACQHLTETSQWGKLAFEKLTKTAMTKHLISVTTTKFHELLQQWPKMSTRRNNACIAAIKAEMVELGITNKLAGSRIVDVPHFGSDVPCKVSSVSELVDTVWEACLRDSARGYNLQEIDFETAAFLSPKCPFGHLVGDEVLESINAVRKDINEKLSLREVKTPETLTRRISRNEEMWRSMCAGVDIEIEQLQGLTGSVGLERTRAMLLQTLPTETVHYTLAEAAENVRQLFEHRTIVVAGDLAHSAVTSVQKVLSDMLAKDIPSKKLLYGSRFMSSVAERLKFLIVTEQPGHGGVIERKFGSDAVKGILDHFWANSEDPEFDLTIDRLEYVKQFRLFMDDDDTDRLLRLKEVVDERTEEKSGRVLDSLTPASRITAKTEALRVKMKRGPASGSKDAAPPLKISKARAAFYPSSK